MRYRCSEGLASSPSFVVVIGVCGGRTLRLGGRILLCRATAMSTYTPSFPLPTAHNMAAKRKVCFFSATLHSPEIAKLAQSICDRPTWVDLKGRDTVPQTVHHVVVRVDPDKDSEVEANLAKAKVQARTDGAAVGVGSEGREEERAERLKRMKPQVRGGRSEGLFFTCGFKPAVLHFVNRISSRWCSPRCFLV